MTEKYNKVDGTALLGICDVCKEVFELDGNEKCPKCGSKEISTGEQDDEFSEYEEGDVILSGGKKLILVKEGVLYEMLQYLYRDRRQRRFGAIELLVLLICFVLGVFGAYNLGVSEERARSAEILSACMDLYHEAREDADDLVCDDWQYSESLEQEGYNAETGN